MKEKADRITKVLLVIGTPMLIYMIPFFLVLVDDRYFDRRFFKSLPPWFWQAFDTIYWPVYVLLN